MTHSKTSALISRQTLRGGAALDSFEGAWELMMDWIRSAPDAQITECSIEPDWDDLDSEDPWRVSLDVLP